MRIAPAMAVVLACAWPAPAAAQRIARYAETVVLAADGSAQVTIELTRPPGAGSQVMLPVAAGTPSDVVVVAPEAAIAMVVDKHGIAHIVVSSPAGASGPAVDDVRVTFRLPRVFDPSGPALAHGNRRVSYRFVNTMDQTIAVFEGVIVLPPGTVVTNVDEVRPESPESAVDAPFVLGRRGDRRAVAVTAASLVWGGEAGVSVRFRPDGFPIWILVALGIASLAYLYRFRDLTRAPDGRRLGGGP